MTRTWTSETVTAPGIIALPDGALIQLERPSVGAIPHVFVDISADGREHRVLIEPRTVTRVGEHLFSITALGEGTVRYRISHVHDDQVPLLQRLTRTLG